MHIQVIKTQLKPKPLLFLKKMYWIVIASNITGTTRNEYLQSQWHVTCTILRRALSAINHFITNTNDER